MRRFILGLMAPSRRRTADATHAVGALVVPWQPLGDRLRRVGALLVAAGLACLVAAPARGAQPLVAIVPATGIVDQVMASHIRGGIARAADDGATAVILKIDTPGGYLDATRAIVQSILDAPIPVITWVAPSGGRAASAGTFITLAGHIALMAPGTNIGAASPVSATGATITGTEATKVTNDAVASITAIAQERGRNVSWAVSTVTEARSSPVSEAVQVGAVDGEAATLAEVLAFADGRSVTVAGRQVTLQLVGARSEEIGMNPLQALLHLLADPNIAYLLFTLGFYGLLAEFAHPNFVTGIVGALALILGFVGMGSLPLNIAGLFLIVLGIGLFVAELWITSHGLLTVAGLACFVLGSGALYTPAGPTGPDVAVAWPLIAVMACTTAAFMTIALGALLRVRRMQPVGVRIGIGRGGAPPTGTLAEVRRPCTPTGSVYALGEEWSARSATAEPIARGQPVRVVGQDGLLLIVERARPAA